MSRYRKIQVRTWGDEKFRKLSPLPPCGQGLWFYLLTGPHTGPIPGLFRAGRAAMAEDLGWPLEAFDKAFGEAFREGMVKADFEARFLWVPNALKHNKPESPNVVTSWGAEFDLLPECSLKAEAYEAIKAFVFNIGEAYGKAFDKAFTKPSAKPSAKAMPNQEQEQEQEQEEDAPPLRGGIGLPEDRPPEDLKRQLYARGADLLGSSSGSIVGKLLKATGNDVAEARAILEKSAGASPPKDYLMAAIHRRGNGASRDLGGFRSSRDL